MTLVERYPYLGGLASGGMVLVLDDMHNGDEITATRHRAWRSSSAWRSVGLAVSPPPEATGAAGRGRVAEVGALGRLDFRAHDEAAADRLSPPPSIPDGCKRVSTT